MSRRGCGIALLLASLALPAGAAPLELGPRLRPVLASRPLRSAAVGVLVIRADDGQVLFAHHPERALIPASNQKVLTAVAALAALGPTHRFTTGVFADRRPDASGAVGTLYVRGSGDPALTTEQWYRLAAELRRAGVDTITGDLVLDDSAFDAVRWHPAWGGITARAYHAPVGALTANYSVFMVEVRPGHAPGAAARIRLDPPTPYLTLSNRAQTGAARTRATLQVGRRRHGDGELAVVSGRLAANADRRRLYASVADPLAYAGAVLRMQLAAVGIAVTGEVRSGQVPADAVELLAFEGRDLAEIVRLTMKYSNNAMAEALLKTLGAQATAQPGSWENGPPALRAQLRSLGVEPSALTLVDGSGLARTNRLTPAALVDALRRARAAFSFGPELRAALPIAGRDGTLARRAARSRDRVRAKTGLLTGATGLSGYAVLADGTEAIFSVLVNGYAGSSREAMDAVDALVAAMVRP